MSVATVSNVLHNTAPVADDTRRRELERLVREEGFRALGVSFKDRGAITDEYLQAMRVLWTETAPRFAGPATSPAFSSRGRARRP